MLRLCVAEGGIISVARGHHTHTLRAPLEVNVTEGAPTVPGNRFLSHFISSVPPFTLLKRPHSNALWEVGCRPVGGVGRVGTES